MVGSGRTGSWRIGVLYMKTNFFCFMDYVPKINSKRDMCCCFFLLPVTICDRRRRLSTTCDASLRSASLAIRGRRMLVKILTRILSNLISFKLLSGIGSWYLPVYLHKNIFIQRQLQRAQSSHITRVIANKSNHYFLTKTKLAAIGGPLAGKCCAQFFVMPGARLSFNAA